MTTYYLGIDGGGTKTGGALVDDTGSIRATCQVGPSCIVGAPSAESCTVLSSVVTRLCDSAGIRPDAIARIGLGLNGIDHPDEIPMQHDALARALSVAPDRLILTNDAIPALWGATPAPCAVILQYGTGFTAAYRSAFGMERLFDHLNAGRCFDLRHEAMMLTARMIDGRAEATGLKDRILACLGNLPEERYAETIYRNLITSAQRDRLLPTIFAAGEDGDPAATALIQRAADDFVCTAGAMIRKTASSAPDVVFGGGRILLAPESFWARLAQGVRQHWPGAKVRRPELPPAVGAAIMTAFADGLPPQAFFRKERA